jgi:hypothetical protein
VWRWRRPRKSLFLHICPYCVGEAIFNGEDNVKEIRAIFNSKPAINEVKEKKDIVITETYKTVKVYLAVSVPTGNA